jgi:hypothetical protein
VVEPVVSIAGLFPASVSGARSKHRCLHFSVRFGALLRTGSAATDFSDSDFLSSSVFCAPSVAREFCPVLVLSLNMQRPVDFSLTAETCSVFPAQELSSSGFLGVFGARVWLPLKQQQSDSVSAPRCWFLYSISS